MDSDQPGGGPEEEPGFGEAWVPADESGEGAWDDGSEELWEQAELGDEAGALAGEDAGEELEDGYGAGEDYGDGSRHTALPSKVEAWRRRSATGAVLTGFAFGLQQVFEPKQDPAVIMETSGEPPKDLPVEADLESGRPRHSVVSIRPWLLPGDPQASGEKSTEHDGAGQDSTEHTEDPEA